MTSRTRTLALALTAILVATGCAARAGEPEAVAVRDAWARATPPGSAVAAVYLTLRGGSAPDRLLAATTPVAEMTQIHDVTETEGLARMREVEAVDVPARGEVRLEPHGLHLMLMHLRQPLAAGGRFVVTLRFERAGERDVEVAIVAPSHAPAAPAP